MQYIQQRSFIATLTSRTPGYEGILDSVELTSNSMFERKHEWLTVSSMHSVQSQQRFWFGYFDGEYPGYRVRAVEFAEGDAHYEAWDLKGNWVGYYLTRPEPVLWRLWAHGERLGVPEVGGQEGVTIAAVGSVPLGVRNRKVYENRYVQAGGANKLIMCLGVEHVNVPLFDGFDRLRHIQGR
ncbi:hypothetical protein [Pseudomonas sp. Marseille-QA0332]